MWGGNAQIAKLFLQGLTAMLALLVAKWAIGLVVISVTANLMDSLSIGWLSVVNPAQMPDPCNPDWAYSLLDQCKEAGVPFFLKQWGEWIGLGINGFGTHKGQIAWINFSGEFLGPPPHDANTDCLTIKRVGKKVAGRLLGGHLYDEYPVRKI
jgi:protein gp37